MFADMHVHSDFSTDSAEAPENILRRAIDLGMKEIYITDHYDIGFFPDGSFTFDPDEYFEVLTKLKNEYKDRIDLHIGVEIGMSIEYHNDILKLLADYPWEFVIGSTHFMDGKDPYNRHEFDMDDEEYFRLYFDTSVELLRDCEHFDSFGHLDYVVRYGYNKDKFYKYGKFAEVIDDVLKELVKKDIALEINTASLRKGLGFAHPYPDVLKRYRELGGSTLSIGSDAHAAEDIGYMFDECIGYIQKFGFTKENIIGQHYK